METTSKTSGTLSLILLSYYSKDRIERCYLRIREILDAERIPFEFIVMDDGSEDESYALALKLEKRYTNVRAYQLSRNYTSHYSIFAGLSVCSGACVGVSVTFSVICSVAFPVCSGSSV